ncbi:hypothetical protein F2Q69_00007169 [Brassica cretica]|uniref:Uncharacterized protein n=1 Tax=Brassica cretica TaxID=69181 RepID=A0A8S9PED2_BRACR|nr:hypothetical protein F2Q69_00007169 [Brassica cretica]
MSVRIPLFSCSARTLSSLNHLSFHALSRNSYDYGEFSTSSRSAEGWGARPTNPAMHACGLMDGALGATDTLHDKPFDIELSSAGPPLPEDDPAGKKSRKA